MKTSKFLFFCVASVMVLVTNAFAGGKAYIPYFSTSGEDTTCIRFSNISTDEIKVNVGLKDQYGNAFTPSDNHLHLFPTGVNLGTDFNLQSKSSALICIRNTYGGGIFGYGTITYDLIDEFGNPVPDYNKRMVAHSYSSGPSGATRYLTTAINSGLPF